MNLPFTGGCVCGEVRYECSSRPLMMVKCHCRDCQRVGGGPYAPVVVVPLKAFKITMDVFVCDAQEWDIMDADLPKHQQYMPRK